MEQPLLFNAILISCTVVPFAYVTTVFRTQNICYSKVGRDLRGLLFQQEILYHGYTWFNQIAFRATKPLLLDLQRYCGILASTTLSCFYMFHVCSIANRNCHCVKKGFYKVVHGRLITSYFCDQEPKIYKIHSKVFRKQNL